MTAAEDLAAAQRENDELRRQLHGAQQALERLRHPEPCGIVNAHLANRVWFQLAQSGTRWKRSAIRTVLGIAVPLICEAIAQQIEALTGLGITVGPGPFNEADELIEKSIAAAAARHGGQYEPQESIPHAAG